jgi:diguanylate cyclase (GGDEF)-like protein/PAS domain S-box-containing protein
MVRARVARMRKSDVAVLLDIDEATSQILGWNAGEMVGRTSLEFIHPDDQTLAVENWMQMLGTHGPGPKVRLRHKHRDGSWVWLEMTNHNLLDDPDSNCIIAEMVDISDEMASNKPLPPPRDDAQAERSLSQQPLRLHEAIRAREQLLHRLAEALPLGVLQSDAEGRVIYTNQKLHTILSTDRRSTVEDQLSSVLPDDKDRMDEAFEAALRGGLDSDLEVRLSTSDEHGEKDIRQCTMSLRALTADSGEITGAIACVVDVTESVRIREELRVRATFDEVTQCHNRGSTMEALEMALTTSDESTQPAVIFVDLYRFKEVNDRLGHAAGDELLGVVAKRLVGAVRGNDLVGRIGGDEFLVVCPGITTSAQAMQTATRISETLRHQVRLKTKRVSCRASIGVAWIGGTRADADTLVSQADAAMYEAKRLGSERPVLYAASRVDQSEEERRATQWYFPPRLPDDSGAVDARYFPPQ